MVPVGPPSFWMILDKSPPLPGLQIPYQMKELGWDMVKMSWVLPQKPLGRDRERRENRVTPAFSSISAFQKAAPSMSTRIPPLPTPGLSNTISHIPVLMTSVSQGNLGSGNLRRITLKDIHSFLQGRLGAGGTRKGTCGGGWGAGWGSQSVWQEPACA